jgi:nucleoside-diphosphate-sugar epimerase
MESPFPEKTSQIDRWLAHPTPDVVEAVKNHSGDYLVLGVGGKMGTTLALMLEEAIRLSGRQATVTGVSRFSRPEVRQALEDEGVKTLACDLADPDSVAQLPQTENIFFLAGQKFGTTDAPEATWIQNTTVPGIIGRHFTSGRIVIFSTGCVYPFAPIDSNGCTEDTPVVCAGDYASSCVGRERIFTHYSKQHDVPGCLFRLNYACELRYGVLVDIATRVKDGEAIDISTGYLNLIWQTDAVAHAIRCLEITAVPPVPINITGAGVHSIRELAEIFAARFGTEAKFSGETSQTAWLTDPTKSHELFGVPDTKLDWMIDMVAQHVAAGAPLLGKPTHFETRDGKF